MSHADLIVCKQVFVIQRNTWHPLGTWVKKYIHEVTENSSSTVASKAKYDYNWIVNQNICMQKTWTQEKLKAIADLKKWDHTLYDIHNYSSYIYSKRQNGSFVIVTHWMEVYFKISPLAMRMDTWSWSILIANHMHCQPDKMADVLLIFCIFKYIQLGEMLYFESVLKSVPKGAIVKIKLWYNRLVPNRWIIIAWNKLCAIPVLVLKINIACTSGPLRTVP